MARLSDCTDGEITQFKNCLARAGVDAEAIRKVNRSKGNALAKTMYQALTQDPEFRLIHGVFTPQSDILAAFKERCVANGIAFEKFSWVGSETPLDFDPNDPEKVVVLNATLDTLQSTFEFAWSWVEDGQEGSWRSDDTVCDPEEMALLDGAKFNPWLLSWARIKLDTDVGKIPMEVRDENSPGCSLLFMSAEHPARIKAIDYKKRFGFWLPGLRCSLPGEQSLQYVPNIGFDQEDCQVLLGAHLGDSAAPGLSIPSFL